LPCSVSARQIALMTSMATKGKSIFNIATVATLSTTTIRSWMLTNCIGSCFIKPFVAKRKGGKRVTQNLIRFDLVEYNKITPKYQTWMMGNSNAEPLEPDNPVQNSTMDQYKAVFRKVHKQQSAQRVTRSVWEQIWTLPIENLHKLVKQRRNCGKAQG
jgi:hypothetical protein